MGAQLCFNTWFVYQTCGECGIAFAMDLNFHDKRKEDGKGWYCPNGHCRIFTETEVTKLKRRLEWAENATARITKNLNRANKSVAAQKGIVTKLKKRVGNGICPCCNRSFANLARHMSGQHPKWKGK